MTCKVGKYAKLNEESARSATDEQLLRIAGIQLHPTHTGPYAGASQRQYNREIRREIRRRGLEPPRLGS